MFQVNLTTALKYHIKECSCSLIEACNQRHDVVPSESQIKMTHLFRAYPFTWDVCALVIHTFSFCFYTFAFCFYQFATWKTRFIWLNEISHYKQHHVKRLFHSAFTILHYVFIFLHSAFTILYSAFTPCILVLPYSDTKYHKMWWVYHNWTCFHHKIGWNVVGYD